MGTNHRINRKYLLPKTSRLNLDLYSTTAEFNISVNVELRTIEPLNEFLATCTPRGREYSKIIICQKMDILPKDIY